MAIGEILSTCFRLIVQSFVSVSTIFTEYIFYISTLSVRLLHSYVNLDTTSEDRDMSVEVQVQVQQHGKMGIPVLHNPRMMTTCFKVGPYVTEIQGT